MSNDVDTIMKSDVKSKTQITTLLCRTKHEKGNKYNKLYKK